MGQQASRPEPGRSIRVIGAGLPRTGTASFSEALAILLEGPVYHGGTQVTIGPEKNIKGWTKLLGRPSTESTEERALIESTMKSLLDGYVAAVDTPTHLFVEEAMSLYPDAKVICTVRDPDNWAESMDRTARTSLQWFLASPYSGFRDCVCSRNTLRH